MGTKSCCVWIRNLLINFSIVPLMIIILNIICKHVGLFVCWGQIKSYRLQIDYDKILGAFVQETLLSVALSLSVGNVYTFVRNREREQMPRVQH